MLFVMCCLLFADAVVLLQFYRSAVVVAIVGLMLVSVL